VEHRTGKSRERELPRGTPHGRCGGEEAWRSGRAGPNAEQNAYRWLAEGVWKGAVWHQWHGRRAGKPLPSLPSLAGNDKLFLVDRGAAAQCTVQYPP
jgi:hypothetical protein